MIPQSKFTTKVCRFAIHKKVCSSGILTIKKSKSCQPSNPVCYINISDEKKISWFKHLSKSENLKVAGD